MSLSEFDEIVDYSAVRGDRDDSRWSPLRIECDVLTPIIDWGDGLYLDGPLAWARFVEWQQADRPALSDINTTPWVEDFELPLAKWEAEPVDGVDFDDRLVTPDGKIWGWCISRAQILESVERKTAIRGSTPTRQYKRWTNATTVKTATGPDKPADKTYPTTVTNRLTWYALGDRDGVARLLEYVTAIGARANVGYGEIKTGADGRGMWSVDIINDDLSLRDGDRLMRRMPMGWDDLERPARMMSVRAPHWHHCRRHMLMEADR